MAVELTMPEVAESVVEGEIGRWLVKEGEFVKQDQPYVEVLTDKVNVEVPSPEEGVLLKIIAQEGEVVKVGGLIAVIGKEGESYEGPAGAAAPAAKTAPTRAAEEAPAPTAEPAAPGRVLAAPAVRKLAHEMGIDLAKVQGSGPQGRVRKEDVLGFSEKAPAKPTVATLAAPEAREERILVRGVRRLTAQLLSKSKSTAVHTLHVDEADVTELVLLREKSKPLAAERGTKLTYVPFILKAVVGALKRFPTMNSSMDDERNEIIVKRYYNIGVAVATDEGLVVPNVKAADQKSLLEIAADIQELSDKARAGKLELEDVQGGTFSITNVGAFGGLLSFPVINHPEAAILGVHKIRKTPVVRDDQIVVRDILNLSLSFDHRIVDGATVAQFTNEIIRLIEFPQLLLLEAK
jgi:pyruvate dehydrogenase E2 component (dihydrolipoamide acetyltransferase)